MVHLHTIPTPCKGRNSRKGMAFIELPNPFPNDKFKTLKEIADDKFKFDKNGRKFSKLAENTVGKGEIARYECVFKRLLLQIRKNPSLFGKGLIFISNMKICKL